MSCPHCLFIDEPKCAACSSGAATERDKLLRVARELNLAMLDIEISANTSKQLERCRLAINASRLLVVELAGVEFARGRTDTEKVELDSRYIDENRYYPRLYHGGPYRAEFTPEALKTIAATYERSAVERVEYSAILVGHYSDDCTTAIVDRLIYILRGEPFQVVQSPEYAANVSTVLRELWDKESGSYYLGDWHTHPLNPSYPSHVDIETSRERASDPNTQCPQLLMAITGCKGTSVHIVTADSLTSLLPQEES